MGEFVQVGFADRRNPAQNNVAEGHPATSPTRPGGLGKEVDADGTIHIVHRLADDHVEMSWNRYGKELRYGIDESRCTLDLRRIRTLTWHIPERQRTARTTFPFSSRSRKLSGQPKSETRATLSNGEQTLE